MQDKTKKSLKHTILFFIISLILVNCEQETIEVDSINTTNSPPKLTSTVFKGGELLQDNKLQNHFKNFTTDITRANLFSKLLYSKTYNLTIDTTLVQKIETKTYTSYTFVINNKKNNPKSLENYVYTYFNDKTFSKHIISYPILIDNSIDIKNANIQNIDSSYLINNRGCYEYIMEYQEPICTNYNCTAGGDHQVGQICQGSQAQQPRRECTEGGWIQNCQQGGDGNDNSGNDEYNPDDSNSGSNPNQDPTEEEEDVVIIPLEPNYALPIINCINSISLTSDGVILSDEMIQWLQSQPKSVVKPITDYLENNTCNVGAQSFVVDAIETLSLGGVVDFEELFIETPTPDDQYIYNGPKSHISNPLILENGNEIIINFGTTSSDNQNANQEISTILISALKQALQAANNNLNQNEKIESIYIMATSNGTHGPGSNHGNGTALDISRINGVKMAVSGVTNQISELQIAFDNYIYIRENFGPYFKHKFYSSNGTWNYNYPVAGHNDHIHVSVR